MGPAWLAALCALSLACSSEPPSCDAARRACGAVCVDVASDARNCGACGAACAPGQLCAAGRCASTCPVGQTRCGDACVDAQQDRANCGRCGNACAAGLVCAAGECDVDCGPLTTCADLVDAGLSLYCANLALDRTNCGSCGATCPPGNVCRGGRCQVTCPVGQLDCGGRCADPASDRLNCGSCGAVCAIGFECAGGRCVIGACAEGTVLCAGSCVDIRTDRNNCGACIARCPSGYLCSGGECRFGCAPGESACGDGCADLQRDPRSCGSCGSACAPGEFCHEGRCGVVCQPAQTLCEGRCVDARTDRAHCGACGRACPGSQVCLGGACSAVCVPERTLCGAVCLDTSSDPANCGECGRACAAGQACVDGGCRALGSPPDAGACPAPSRMCATGCVDVRSDNGHCGACGAACPGDTLCFNGACVRPCVGAEARCPGGACVNTQADVANCGACGVACDPGLYCVRGRCTATAPPARYTAEFNPSSVEFLDACAVPGASRLLEGVDEGEERLSLPFPMRYWTSDLPEGAPVTLSTNGWIGMSGAAYGLRSFFIPSTGAPNGVISLHGGDLQNVGPVCVVTVGAAPVRRWLIEWSNAQERNTAGPIAGSRLAFEAILSERSDTIDLLFQRMDGAVSRYTGLEAPAGSAGSAGCQTATSTTYFCAPPAGARVRFTPAP